MEQTKKSTGLYWGIFVVSTIACIAMMIFMPQYFWVTLPFVCTSLALAFDVI